MLFNVLSAISTDLIPICNLRKIICNTHAWGGFIRKQSPNVQNVNRSDDRIKNHKTLRKNAKMKFSLKCDTDDNLNIIITNKKL